MGGQSLYSYTAEGAVLRKASRDGTVSTWCYGARGEVQSTVGGGGEVSEVVTNFRRQRVAELWPLNGLREDFRVDESSRLLVEAGAASLTAQYPRPTREYVWLGGHPVAVIESIEAQSGAVTQNGVTYLFSGQLGEVLTETAPSGAVLRQYEYTPFGERHELPLPSTEQATKVPFFTLLGTMMGYVTGPTGTSSMQLHFTDATLAGCTITVRNSSDYVWLGTYANVRAGDSTDWMPSADLALEVTGCSGGGADWQPTIGVGSSIGTLVTMARSEGTSSPYPAAGQHFSLSLPTPSYLEFDSVALASCDKLEARSAGGQTLWQWKPAPSLTQGGALDSKGYTSKLSGTVDVGVWGAGCNATEGKAGFQIVQVLSEQGVQSGPPVSITLPGQKLRYDGTVDNWYRTYDPLLGRYLSPEPLLQNPRAVLRKAKRGLSLPTYAYANNNPLKYVDRNGRDYTGVGGGWWTTTLPPLIPILEGVGAAGVGAAGVGVGLAGGVGIVGGVIGIGPGQFPDPPAGVPHAPTPSVPIPHPSSEPGCPEPRKSCNEIAAEFLDRCYDECHDLGTIGAAAKGMPVSGADIMDCMNDCEMGAAQILKDCK